VVVRATLDASDPVDSSESLESAVSELVSLRLSGGGTDRRIILRWRHVEAECHLRMVLDD
jgi:hypothetical protein